MGVTVRRGRRVAMGVEAVALRVRVGAEEAVGVMVVWATL